MRGQLELTPTYEIQLDGKILANAHAMGDIDGDGATELLFGSLMGKVSVFKSIENQLVQWKSCNVNGTVTSLCLASSIVRDTKRILVATAEGKCSSFCSVEGNRVLQLCSEFNVALNICDTVYLNSELIVATRDGRVLVYRLNLANADDLAEFVQVAQVEINEEIETLIMLQSDLQNPDASPRVLARCFSGHIFCIDRSSEANAVDKQTVVPWNSPLHDNDGITFVVPDIELGGKRGMVALVSMNGLVSLFSSLGERQWDFQLPEAVVNADKLEMTAPDGHRHDAIVVCTWSGQIYAFQSEQRLVRFRMLLPACSMFCVGIRDLSAQIDPTIVGISTSGIVFVYRDVQETLIRGLQDSTLTDKIKESAVFYQLESSEKRKVLMKKLQNAFPQFVVSAKTATPSVEDLIKAMLAIPLQP
ncbi:unnamed protein product [Peronospora belbahrii]|uniref:Integrin-alpha FG-GAP repeat-containing protein 2 n=1 Tax=Peronospora belbahrii TaxID=622444 RepID=A0ABN8CTS9_9STRA|nr:unnamed protein product [Peronospora belbahrii]